MHNISTELTRIINHIAAAIDFETLHSKEQLNYFLFELRKSACPLVVYDFNQPALVFAGEALLQWLGEKQGCNLTELLHRSRCMKETGEYLLHFINQPHTDLAGHYTLLKADGSPLLLYGCSRCISFTDKGRAHLVITLLCPVDYVYGLSLQNGTAHNPALTDDELKRFESLTPREKEILTLMLNDKTDDEIAAELNISTNTIRSHRSNILKKLGLNTPTGLVKYGAFF